MAAPTMELESLVVKLIGDASNFDAVIRETQRKIDDVTRSIKNSVKGIQQSQKSLLAEAASIEEAFVTPMERYERAWAKYKQHRDAGTLSDRALLGFYKAVSRLLPSNIKLEKEKAKAEKEAAAAQEKINTSLQRGSAVLASFTPRMSGYAVAVHKLNMQLRAGRITNEGYEKSLKRILNASQTAKSKEAGLRTKAAFVARQYHSPVERYVANVKSLDAMRGVGLSTALHKKLKIAESGIYLENIEALHRERKKTGTFDEARELHGQYVKALQRGVSILPMLTNATHHYGSAIAELNRHLKQGKITTATYEEELDKLIKKVRQSQAAFNANQSKAIAITQQHATPAGAFYNRKNELNALRQSGLSHKLHIALLKEEEKAYQNNIRAMRMAGLTEATAAEATKLHNEYLARAKQLIQQGTTAQERYNKDKADLNRLLKSGYLNLMQYTAALKQLNRQNQFFAQHLNKVAFQLRVVSSSLSRFGAGLRSIGMMMSLFTTAPLTGFAATGIRELYAFDKAMTKSLSIAENVTPQLKQQMEQVAIALSEKTAHSATELAGAYYELISAGLDVKTSMMSLQTASMFAVAGDMELTSSVNKLAKATAAMGLKTEDAMETAAGMYRVANVLSQAANLTSGSIGDMTQALVNAAAPQAKILNMQLEDTVAILMHYIQVGETASDASSHFAIGLRLIGTAYDKHKGFWQQKGLTLYKDGEMRKFTDVLRDIQKIYHEMRPESRVSFLHAMGFEDLQQRSLNSLLADPKAVEQIEKWEKQLHQTGALERVFGEQMKSLSNQFLVFRNTVLNVSREVGLMLLPYLQKGISLVALMIGYWKGMNDEGKRVAVIIAAVVAGAGPLIAAFGTMVTLTAAVAAGISAVITAIIAMTLPVSAAVAAFAMLAAAIAAVGAYSLAMELWPQETKKIMRVLERMWNAFAGFMVGVFDKIFTVDLVKSAMLGFGKLLTYIVPMGGLLRKALSGKDVRKDAANYSKNVAKQIQDSFDKLHGSENLGATLTNIIVEEMGASNLGEKLKEQMNVDKRFSNITEKVKEMANIPKQAAEGTTGFSKLSEDLNEFNERLKESIALEKEQAKIGYDKINKMTGAEKELFKLEMKIEKERQAILSDYRKRQPKGLEPDPDIKARRKQALEAHDKMYEPVLKETRKRVTEQSHLEHQRQRHQDLQTIINRDPVKKFGEQMKDLGDAYATGQMSAEHYRKELQELRAQMLKEYKINFKVSGTKALRHGTAETKAAIENFLMLQKEALKPIPTPEQPGRVPEQAAANRVVTQVTKHSFIPHTGDGKETNAYKRLKRLENLSRGSGPVAAHARRLLGNAVPGIRTPFKSQRLLRLHELANKGGNIGYHARQQLFRSFGVLPSSYKEKETQRLQGLADKGGRMGYYARQQLKKMGVAPQSNKNAPQKQGTSPATRRVEETKAQQSELGILKSMDKHLAAIAKKKSVEIEPANLT